MLGGSRELWSAGSSARARTGAPPTRDVVGELIGLDAESVIVDTRAGLDRGPGGQIATARLVSASPADELALEAVAARGWRAAETAELGGWLLRADGGFTGRANSVLPLRTPEPPAGRGAGRLAAAGTPSAACRC